MKEGRIIALGDKEVDKSTAFSPVDLGHDGSRLIRNLLRKFVPETLAKEDYSPRVILFEGCSGGPLLRLRARTGKGQEQLGALNISTFTLRPVVQGVAAQHDALVINLDD